MTEANFDAVLKKLTEAMKDLVTEANFDCSTTGISDIMLPPNFCCLTLANLATAGAPHRKEPEVEADGAAAAAAADSLMELKGEPPDSPMEVEGEP